MNETFQQWARSKFDTVLLLALFVFLMKFADMDLHKEVLGALLLALTGARSSRAPDPQPPAVLNHQKEIE